MQQEAGRAGRSGPMALVVVAADLRATVQRTVAPAAVGAWLGEGP